MNRVTQESITDRIKSIRFTRLAGETTTICSIDIINGFTVHGESACVDPANFDQGIGEQMAYKDAFSKIWQLEGYLLAEKIWQRGPVGDTIVWDGITAVHDGESPA